MMQSTHPDHIAWLLGAVFRRLQHQLAAEQDPLLRASHVRVLDLVTSAGSRPSDLADRAGITRQGIGQLVDHLEQHGFVKQTPDPVDGRARIVRTTAKGRRSQVATRARIARVEKRWAAEVGTETYALIRGALTAIAAGRDD